MNLINAMMDEALVSYSAVCDGELNEAEFEMHMDNEHDMVLCADFLTNLIGA